MAVNCNDKSWTWRDVFRNILAPGFIPRIPGSAAGDQIPYRAIKLVVVEDSGESYFCGNEKFRGFDTLAKQLSGLYSAENEVLALRVSLGTIGTGEGLCANPIRSYSEDEMILSAIGKGVDGKPLLRLAFDIASDVT